MIRLLCSVVLALVIATSLPTLAQTSDSEVTGILKGRISDSSGAAIASAFVYVQGDNKVSQQIPLNENGEFNVQLPPGLYNFFVGSLGSAPFAKEVKVLPKRPVVLKIKLHVDTDLSFDE